MKQYKYNIDEELFNMNEYYVIKAENKIQEHISHIFFNYKGSKVLENIQILRNQYKNCNWFILSMKKHKRAEYTPNDEWLHIIE